MFTIRPFQPTDSAYEAIANIEKAVFPDNPDTIDDFRYADQTRNPALAFQRLVIETQEQVIGFATYAQQLEVGRYQFYIVIHPDFQGHGAGTAVYDHILATLVNFTPAPRFLVTSAYEHKTQSIRFLQQRGFRQTMRWIISTLTVSSFDDAPFSALAADIASQGIHIEPLSAVKQTDPNWQQALHELDWLLVQDEPLPYMPEKLPLEQYVKREIESPNILHDAWFVARENGRYVGMTQLFTSDDSTTYKTGFTGVVRSHRRRGLATLLKLHAIRYAKDNGIQTIRTGNEENNPMYTLNRKLGFQDLTANLAFEKEINSR